MHSSLLNTLSRLSFKSSYSFCRQPRDRIIKDFKELTKAKLSFNNSLIAYSGYIVSKFQDGQPLIDPTETILFFIATQSLAMVSQTQNQIIEVSFDKQMNRTRNRPLPTGRISIVTAQQLVYLGYSLSNVIYLSVFPMQSVLAANLIYFSYIKVYTPAKRSAISGSLPPVLGYLAAGGSLTISISGLSMSIINPVPAGLFLYMMGWQYQHFYGILWKYQQDYLQAGFVMITDPVTAGKHLNIALITMSIAQSGVFFILYDSLMCSIPIIFMQNALLYYTAYIPIKNFIREQSKIHAHKMKMYSYCHMLGFLAFIFAKIIYEKNKNIHNTIKEKIESMFNKNKIKEEKDEKQ